MESVELRQSVFRCFYLGRDSLSSKYLQHPVAEPACCSSWKPVSFCWLPLKAAASSVWRVLASIVFREIIFKDVEALWLIALINIHVVNRHKLIFMPHVTNFWMWLWALTLYRSLLDTLLFIFLFLENIRKDCSCSNHVEISSRPEKCSAWLTAAPVNFRFVPALRSGSAEEKPSCRGWWIWIGPPGPSGRRHGTIDRASSLQDEASHPGVAFHHDKETPDASKLTEQLWNNNERAERKSALQRNFPGLRLETETTSCPSSSVNRKQFVKGYRINLVYSFNGDHFSGFVLLKTSTETVKGVDSTEYYTYLIVYCSRWWKTSKIRSLFW